MAEQLLHTGFRFYQSANADAESIKESFIIRRHEYEIIIGDIRRNPMQGSIQHYLVLGRRGSGKSTLLKRLQVEIESDSELQENFIAINLAEEQANIYRLSDLWNEILQEIEHAGLEVIFPDWEDDAQNYSRKLIGAVHTAIHLSGKKIILLLDNIDRIFENLKEDAALLREYLLNFDDLRIIGGSTRMTEHFWKYDQPFYEFFRVLKLNPLGSDEVKRLLLFWSEKLGQPELKTFVEKQTGQLETVRILTDGLPRTLQFFVKILLTNTQETGYEYLCLIMDQVTPLYQERLNNLPPAQRKIVLQMAFIWEAAGTKEISAAARMDTNVVSAQLKQLAAKSIVEIAPTDNKNHLYRLAERFFNLWLIFTQGSPHEKRKARYLTIFLENFYDANEIRRLATEHLERLKTGAVNADKAGLLSKVFAQSRYISSMARDEIIWNTVGLPGMNTDLIRQLPLLTGEINKKIDAAIVKKDWNTALRLANDIEQEDENKWFCLGYIYGGKDDFTNAEKYYLMAIELKDVGAMNNLAILYYQLQKYEEAEKYYLLAVELKDAAAMYNLANLYDDFKRYEEAESYYLMAIELEETKAMNNLANLYHDQKRYEEAEKYYLLAVESKEVDALYNLANLYRELRRYEEAEKYYLLAIESNNVKAINNLANLYSDLQRYPEAEKYYLMAVEAGHFKGAYNLANLYNDQKRYEEAEKYYLLAIESKDVQAMYNLANLYRKLQRYEEAEKYYLMAIDNNDIDALFNLPLLFYKQNKNKLKAVTLIDQFLLKNAADLRSQSLKTAIDLWNGDIANAIALFTNSLKKNDFSQPQISSFISEGLQDFLIHRQVNLVFNLFNDAEFGNKLIEAFQPIYYAASIFAEKDKKIMIKIPPEIRETVDKIVASVEEKTEFYYGK